jgi:hypothetical protein
LHKKTSVPVAQAFFLVIWMQKFTKTETRHSSLVALATLTLIILFFRKFEIHGIKIFLKEYIYLKENKVSFTIFWCVLFSNMEFSKQNGFSLNMLYLIWGMGVVQGNGVGTHYIFLFFFSKVRCA